MEQTPDDWSQYVECMAAVHGLVFDDCRHAEVVVQFRRIAALAHLIMEFPLATEDEPAPVFRP